MKLFLSGPLSLFFLIAFLLHVGGCLSAGGIGATPNEETSQEASPSTGGGKTVEPTSSGQVKPFQGMGRGTTALKSSNFSGTAEVGSFSMVRIQSGKFEMTGELGQ